MKTYNLKIKGRTPLLQHRFSEEALFGLLGSKSEKKKVQEVKTPREIAESHAYKAADGSFYIPSEYLIGAIRHVASDYKQKNSQRKSLKQVIVGAIRPEKETVTLLDEGRPITAFEVDVRRAVNHKAGAVAVCRPRFDRWEAEVNLMIDDTIVDEKTALQMIEDAGLRAGVGSFRIQRGGYFGSFQVTEWKQI